MPFSAPRGYTRFPSRSDGASHLPLWEAEIPELTPSRFTKMLLRRMTVTWREQPTQYDIEALRANIRRVGLVIKVRWSLVAALAVFSLLGGAAYTFEVPLARLAQIMLVPALGLVFVAGYNTFYQVNYKRLGNVAVLNQAQLLLDVVVVTLLVYYSGGVYSWFDAMYLLFILEAAFILPKRWHVWLIASAAMACYAGVLLTEYFRVMPHIDVPFVNNQLQTRPVYVAVRLLWDFTVMAGTAMVSTVLVGDVRRREHELAANSIIDATTGLYNRTYFHQILTAEFDRAKRHGRYLTLLLVDIDNFDGFNRMFGHEAGDKMLTLVASAIRDGATDRAAGDETAIVCRIGGEEFAVLLPEIVGSCDQPPQTCGQRIAEQVRMAVGEARYEDMSVTVSIGMAAFPGELQTATALLNGADNALSEAAGRGGNRIVSAVDLSPNASRE